MNRLGNIIRPAVVMAMALSAVACMKNEHVTGSVEVTSDRILLSDVGTPVHVALDANMEWRIEYDTDNGWMSTDLMGGQASTKGFMVEGTQNSAASIRSQKIRVFTVDRASEKEITVIQLSSYPAIVFESTATMALMAAETGYSIAFTANIPMDRIVAEPSVDWLKDVAVSEDGHLTFTATENTEQLRQGYIELSYQDDNGRRAEAIVKVEQAAPSIYNSAAAISIADALQKPEGEVTDNVYIEGVITSVGSSKNLPANRYFVQDPVSGSTIILESENMIAFTRFNTVRIALMDTEAVTESEGDFNYKVFRNVTVSHLLKFEESDFTAPTMSIGQLTDDMVFRTVTLTDVEMAMTAGAYTNFKTCFPGNADQKSPAYFVELFPDYYRYYPVPVRDSEGNHIYMLNSMDVDWAHTSLPTGSGSLTGVLMKVSLPNFDIDETALCIVPVAESDLGISDAGNNVSEVIAGWNCDLKLTDPNDGNSYILPENNTYNPDDGLLAGADGVVLNKNGNTGFDRGYKVNILGYQDSFRGDVNQSDANDGWNGTVSNGYFGRVNGGAFNSQPWNTGELHTDFFYIDGISTQGYSAPLSLQVSMNTGGQFPEFAVEYSTSLSDDWTEVERFKVLAQFDRSDPGRQKEQNVPGYKFYDFRLPDACLNQTNLCIRLRIVSDEKDPRIRLDHIQLKYNK